MGYLKDDFVIVRMTEAGFEFAGQSDINFNAKDEHCSEAAALKISFLSL